MFRRSISIILLLSFLSCSLHSCGGGSSTSPEPTENEIFTDFKDMPVLFESPGTIHNEVLRAFHRRHNLITGGKLRKREFVRLVTRSFNEVMSARGIRGRVTQSDIRTLVGQFEALRQRGVFDFFKPYDTFPAEAFDILAAEKIIPIEAARQYKALFLKVRAENVPERRIEPLQIDTNDCATDDPMRDEFFVDVLTSSQSIWNELAVAVFDTLGPDIDETLLQKIDSILQQYGADSAAALFFLYTLPLTYAGGITGIAFSVLGSMLYCTISDYGFYDWGDMSSFPIIP